MKTVVNDTDAVKQLEEEFFPDGYCDCRCGPDHHRLIAEPDIASQSTAIFLVCGYHKKTCRRLVFGNEFDGYRFAVLNRKLGRHFRQEDQP